MLKYLISERLKFNIEDVKGEVSKMFLTKHKLHTASKLFGRSAIRYIICAYPEVKYQPWQFMNDKVPQSYWMQESNRINALKYIFEVDLQWSIEDIKEKLNCEIIRQQRLYTLHSYYPNIHHICNALYPGKIKPWELRHSEVSDVGKMTVGQEFMKITDLRLFHNHMTIEPVIEIFGYYAASENYGLIFTYMWAFYQKFDYKEILLKIF